MEGTKEHHSSSKAQNHHQQQQEEKEQQLGLGFQKPALPNPPSDPTLDPTPISNDDELNQKLDNLVLKDSFNQEELCTLFLAPATDEETEIKQAIDQVNHSLELKEAINEEALQVESSNLVTLANNNALSAEPPDRALSGFVPEKCHDAKNSGVNDEEIIHKEEERAPEKCPFLEENETENKELKEGNSNEHRRNWSENGILEGNDNMKVNEEEQGIIDKYENYWSGPESGEDNARRVEANEEQGIFAKYEDERSENEQNDEGHNGYGNVEGDTLGLKDGKYRTYHYPLRPDAEDCSYYMKTGTCKFGSNCKFNHPLRRRNQQAAKEPLKQKEENSNRLGQTECKYYSTSGGCKYGNACRYNHSRGKIVVAPILEFNFLGLPIRQGEKECPYYMRNGSCKYGSNCRFNHPDPTAVGGGDPLSGYGDSSVQGGSKDTISGWSSARSLNETAPFMPLMYPPTPGAPPKSEWNGYKVPHPTSESSLPTPPAFSMNFPASDAKFYSQHQQQMPVGEYPERPGQPECSYFVKTGDCKYRSGCKFHHPKNRNPKTSSSAVSDQGLPLRPDQNICTHYSRYGICKFGPACKYDHPVTYGNSGSSAGSGHDQPQYGNSATADREWERESLMQQSV